MNPVHDVNDLTKASLLAMRTKWEQRCSRVLK